MIKKLLQLSFIWVAISVLSACSSISLNPFASDNKEQSLSPQNATEYRCEGGAHFYVRMLNNGNDAWLIYPQHEVNLVKAGDSQNRFVSGLITLVIDGNNTTLNDGEKTAYTACKPQEKK